MTQPAPAYSGPLSRRDVSGRCAPTPLGQFGRTTQARAPQPRWPPLSAGFNLCRVRPGGPRMQPMPCPPASQRPSGKATPLPMAFNQRPRRATAAHYLASRAPLVSPPATSPALAVATALCARGGISGLVPSGSLPALCCCFGLGFRGAASIKKLRVATQHTPPRDFGEGGKRDEKESGVRPNGGSRSRSGERGTEDRGPTQRLRPGGKFRCQH